MSKKLNTQQEVIELLKTGYYDTDGHLCITNKTYRSFCKWYMSTLNEWNLKVHMETKKLYPSKYKSFICNVIGQAFHNITKDRSAIHKVCIYYKNGSFDFVSSKFEN